MREVFELSFHVIVTLIKLSQPGGVKSVMAENLAIKQQLVVLNRGRKRAPPLTTFDRFFFGLLVPFMGTQRIKKIAVLLKPATILRFHQALVQQKYHLLYSNKTTKKPGRKSPDQAIIDLVIALKTRNPGMGYGRIAMQIYQAFGIKISRFTVGRILRKYNIERFPGPGSGPSWLTFIGHMKDSLWSVDLFRCESVLLKSHWVMIVIDQFSRRIIGFSVHVGDCTGKNYCRLFNSIVSGRVSPKFLSTDNDPLFLYHRWQANLRILDITEIKSVPGCPTSHPFVERAIKTVRTEYLDHLLFFNAQDLQKKLDRFQCYYNETRAHSSLDIKTPHQMSENNNLTDKAISLSQYEWKSHCGGLYQLPVSV